MTFTNSGRELRIGLVGNPNCGKSTIFNQLTGLRQKTGNFPGVTVEVKEGAFSLPGGQKAELVDFPGAYSLYPTATDERVVVQVLTNPADPHYPDLLIYVADATHLEKHMLLFTQVLDLGIPVLLALNMCDVAEEEQIKLYPQKIAQRYRVPVVPVSGRTGENINKLKTETETLWKSVQGQPKVEPTPFYTLTDLEKAVVQAIAQNLPQRSHSPYQALLLAHHCLWLDFLTAPEQATLGTIVETKQFQSLRAQVEETLERFDHFTPHIQEAVQKPPAFPITTTDRIDAVLTHRVAGPLVFFGVMFMVFMVVFYGYETTGGWVENAAGWGIDLFAEGLQWVFNTPWLTDFVAKGVLEGFKGVLVFVPQVALLSLIIALLEEVGYLSRAVFMFDRTMRQFGMNGRSIVALISGGACAVPAIKGTRTISNWKERMITILVTPFISCSARIPVYMVLIPVALPKGNWWTWALTFTALYLLGIVAALGSGWVLKKVLKSRETSFLAMEMPVYRVPHWKNVWLTVFDKVKGFVTGVWKPILIITVTLWVLSSFGPGDVAQKAADAAQAEIAAGRRTDSERADLVASYRLEYSWTGQIGQTIEPLIRPLGYDWKIGIGILSSFLAREVFNSTMYIIYSLESVGKVEDEAAGDQKPFERYTSLRARMEADTFKGTDDKVYTSATGLSLLVFYALAMQCMSTLAIVKQETGRWYWALAQFVGMSVLAYLCAWLVQLLFA
jgi:ferrous iron transport protein B